MAWNGFGDVPTVHLEIKRWIVWKKRRFFPFFRKFSFYVISRTHIRSSRRIKHISRHGKIIWEAYKGIFVRSFFIPFSLAIPPIGPFFWKIVKIVKWRSRDQGWLYRFSKYSLRFRLACQTTWHYSFSSTLRSKICPFASQGVLKKLDFWSFWPLLTTLYGQKWSFFKFYQKYIKWGSFVAKMFTESRHAFGNSFFGQVHQFRPFRMAMTGNFSKNYQSIINGGLLETKWILNLLKIMFRD